MKGRKRRRASAAVPKAEVELDELKLVTLNVDGLGNYYAAAPAVRMDAILDQVLVAEPNVLVLQEMTVPMFTQLRRRLPEWKASHVDTAASSFASYFNVTLMRHGSEQTTLFPLPESANGRHLVMTHQSRWTILNIQAESGSTSPDRVVRKNQLDYMSRFHKRGNTTNVVF